ncbi:hypothetical protein RchiOBHm_Chr5g0028641 [Rosa chinensis]|uniref:Uncharacterized protein n=1 Tax=Rosa chinensis TaxID=74649 RepID=A0A2P6Q9F1_ROSCH|nr:hypothetical protein RchiOBHm_Chr5g0028641 [Rosa chinensis]
MMNRNGLLFLYPRHIQTMIKPPNWQIKFMPNLKLILAPRRERGAANSTYIVLKKPFGKTWNPR